jgi:hypothetical protein
MRVDHNHRLRSSGGSQPPNQLRRKTVACGMPLELASSPELEGGRCGEAEKIVADVCLGLPGAVVPGRARQVVGAVEQVTQWYSTEVGDCS